MEYVQQVQCQSPIAAWATWTSDDAVPVLEFIEPMLRRRLSPLAKISLWVANQCAHDKNNVRMVYASQHGEIARTTGMLEEIINNQPVSPTAFSMSVLNASIGLYSIIHSNTSPATAISAGAETFGFGLLEAHTQLASNPDHPVLFMYADEPVPDVWQAKSQPSSYALALLLKHDASTHLYWGYSPYEGTASATTQAQVFAQNLGSAPAMWAGTQRRWQWHLTSTATRQ